MNSIVTKIKIQVYGTRNSWSLSPHNGMSGMGKFCEVTLEIQGDPQNGYHLEMSPEGFFMADSWHETKQEALDSARELFGVAHNDWVKTPATASK